MNALRNIIIICFLSVIGMSFEFKESLNPPTVYNNQVETDSSSTTLITFVEKGSIGIKKYDWVQTYGNIVSFPNSDTLQFPSVSGLKLNNIYEFMLTVTDSNNLVATGTVIIRTYSLAAIKNGITLQYIGNKIGGFSR